MVRFKAAWLPQGEVELAPLPLTGEREIHDLSLRYRELHAAVASMRFVALASGILKARRILAARGPAMAKQSWDDFVLATSGLAEEAAALIVPEDQFATFVETTRDRIVIQNLAAKDDEDADAKLKKMAEESMVAMQKFDDRQMTELVQRPLLELYWRLRASGVKAILTPGGEVAIDWHKPGDADAEAKKAAAITLLADVVNKEDLEQLKEQKTKPLDAEDLRPRTAADVEGKSVPTSPASTDSKPSSAPSSAPTTVTPTASG